jgi:hypothetical protein
MSSAWSLVIDTLKKLTERGLGLYPRRLMDQLSRQSL